MADQPACTCERVSDNYSIRIRSEEAGMLEELALDDETHVDACGPRISLLNRTAGLSQDELESLGHFISPGSALFESAGTRNRQKRREQEKRHQKEKKRQQIKQRIKENYVERERNRQKKTALSNFVNYPAEEERESGQPDSNDLIKRDSEGKIVELDDGLRVDQPSNKEGLKQDGSGKLFKPACGNQLVRNLGWDSEERGSRGSCSEGSFKPKLDHAELKPVQVRQRRGSRMPASFGLSQGALESSTNVSLPSCDFTFSVRPHDNAQKPSAEQGRTREQERPASDLRKSLAIDDALPDLPSSEEPHLSGSFVGRDTLRMTNEATESDPEEVHELPPRCNKSYSFQGPTISTLDSDSRIIWNCLGESKRKDVHRKHCLLCTHPHAASTQARSCAREHETSVSNYPAKGSVMKRKASQVAHQVTKEENYEGRGVRSNQFNSCKGEQEAGFEASTSDERSIKEDKNLTISDRAITGEISPKYARKREDQELDEERIQAQSPVEVPLSTPGMQGKSKSAAKLPEAVSRLTIQDEYLSKSESDMLDENDSCEVASSPQIFGEEQPEALFGDAPDGESSEGDSQDTISVEALAESPPSEDNSGFFSSGQDDDDSHVDDVGTMAMLEAIELEPPDESGYDIVEIDGSLFELHSDGYLRPLSPSELVFNHPIDSTESSDEGYPDSETSEESDQAVSFIDSDEGRTDRERNLTLEISTPPNSRRREYLGLMQAGKVRDATRYGHDRPGQMLAEFQEASLSSLEISHRNQETGYSETEGKPNEAIPSESGEVQTNRLSPAMQKIKSRLRAKGITGKSCEPHPTQERFQDRLNQRDLGISGQQALVESGQCSSLSIQRNDANGESSHHNQPLYPGTTRKKDVDFGRALQKRRHPFSKFHVTSSRPTSRRLALEDSGSASLVGQSSGIENEDEMPPLRRHSGMEHRKIPRPLMARNLIGRQMGARRIEAEGRSLPVSVRGHQLANQHDSVPTALPIGTEAPSSFGSNSKLDG
ncbi:hypothetical protein IE53DRAFT_18426 [Violaceomyces palustris]|uniref:Uncharacterized protein n=1 Tax=Violaceomyces palustris TaxID=1673888 RepID=A0ACD0P210_9BASI|nr:hypothetical protein IE53DRAFT_18426 [Violaceomyces palustris]